MGTMTAGHAAIPTGRPFTVADLEAMSDGNRYELIVDAFDAELPFPVRIVPVRLLDGLRP